MTCICQRAYDTGYTGIPRVDRRLQRHYDTWLDPDAIKRSYDHYHFGVPYTDAQRRPYCFVTKTKGFCVHEPCEHARHRPPTTVAKMRFYIEQNCPATVHYPNLLDTSTVPEIADSGGVSFETLGEHEKWGTPIYRRRFGTVADESGNKVADITCLIRTEKQPSDRAIEERERWDAEQFRLHKNIGFVPRQARLSSIPVEDFREYVAEQLYGVDPMDTGTAPTTASLDQLTAAGVLHVTQNLELAASHAARLAGDAVLQMLDTDPQTEPAECGVEVVAA